MRRRRYRSHDEEPKLMLSPMIDMMFLCLVFFIVSTMYMSDIRTIPGPPSPSGPFRIGQ